MHEYRLTRLNEPAIRAILNVDDDIPVEPFDFDIPTVEAVRAFIPYADEPIALDETLLYQLGCYAPD